MNEMYTVQEGEVKELRRFQLPVPLFSDISYQTIKPVIC